MPANTAYGFPYPLPTEPVAEGAQAIRNLAESADARMHWRLLSDVTLASVANVDFTAIPQTYRDLAVVWHGNAASGSGIPVAMQLNGDGSNNYITAIQGTVDIVTPAQGYAQIGRTGVTAVQSVGRLMLVDYRSSINKGWLGECFSFDGTSLSQHGGYWGSSAAVNRVFLIAWGAAGFAIGSRFTLYGVR